MAGPWEKYQTQQESGPWDKYAGASAAETQAPAPQEKTLQDYPEYQGFGGDFRGRTAALQSAILRPTLVHDELAAAIQSLPSAIPGGETYGQAYERNRAENAQREQLLREAYPVTSFLGELPTAIAGGKAIATQAGKAAPKLAEKVMQYAARHPYIAGSGAGAVSGGVYGFGTGSGGIEERAGQALPMAIAGTGGGLGSTMLSRTAGPVYKRVAEFVEKRKKAKAPVSQAIVTQNQPAAPFAYQATEEGYTPEEGQQKAFQKIVTALKTDFPDNWQQKLEQYAAGDVALADLQSPSMMKLMQGSAQFKTGEAPAREYFKKEIPKAQEEMIGKTYETLGGGLTIKSVDDIVEAGQKQVAPLYDEAFAANPSVASKELDNLLRDPMVKTLLKNQALNLRRQGQNPAVSSPELTELANELESIGLMKRKDKAGVAAGLKLKTLDAIKKEIGRAARDADSQFRKGNIGFQEREGIIALNKSFTEQLKTLDKTGKYAKALEQSGDYIGVREAAEKGEAFFKEGIGQPRKEIEFTKKYYNNLTEPEKRAFKLGAADFLSRRAGGKLGDPTNPYNDLFIRGGARDKLAFVLPAKDFAELESYLRGKKELWNVAHKVLGNSTSVEKAIAAGEFSEGALLQMVDDVSKGGLMALPKSVITQHVRKIKTGLNEKLAGNVADIIYEKDPMKKLAIINSLNKKQLTQAEQRLVKETYFQIESKAPELSIPFMAGAGAAIITDQQGEQ